MTLQGAPAVAVAIALTVFLAPAAGVPNELMLQDTLKSAIVAFGTLLAALLFFWQQRRRTQPLLWHPVLWLPIALMAYAMGSMVWSHAYLGGVEAARWFVFALLGWLVLNGVTRERLPMLAVGIHAGAAVASLWAVLQFVADWRFFPQGPRPASSFINRNFYAELAVCALPWGLMLLARARTLWAAAALGTSSGLVVVGILMTGTRSALVALALLLAGVAPLVAWRWRASLRTAAAPAIGVGLLVATVLALGVVPTGSADIAQEGRGVTGFARALNRAQAIHPGDESLNIRMVMWRATAHMIADHPIAGVGAGAWENEVPLYQDSGAQLETDYYVHNEYLQLLAEYGVVGWVALLVLLGWLVQSAVRTWRAVDASAEAPWRVTALASLLALLVVSSIGFPWRMAATGALFSVSLGVLAGSDARLAFAGIGAARPVPWQPSWSLATATACAALLLVTAYATRQAATAERLLVRSAQIALAISGSGDPRDARWDNAKQRVLAMVEQGVAINPHYRKITPIVADELARWGDWRNATWVWESVLQSRPHIVAILANAARGHVAMGEDDQARRLLARAAAIQPQAPAVQALQIILAARSGDEARALALARQAMAGGLADVDALRITYLLATRGGDAALAREALRRLPPAVRAALAPPPS